jgi:hypothetical protein
MNFTIQRITTYSILAADVIYGSCMIVGRNSDYSPEQQQPIIKIETQLYVR